MSPSKKSAKPQKQKWVVTSAWPYSNATPHLGNMIGSVLSADVFARYLRLKGDEVVFVSGTDEHGTPIEVAAIEQGVPVEDLAERNHQKIASLFKAWNISYDNYTRTHNPVHIKYTQDFYLQVQKSGYVFTETNDALYCEHDNLFLPDRFVEGTCPHCGSDRARGDQCDSCGALLNPTELVEPKCKVCGQTPGVRKSTHWYMDFPKLEGQLREFIEGKTLISDNARTSCIHNIEGGIPPRAITRDLKWGIPAPFEGAEGKTIYVWFEAVLGYISATKQWAEEILGEPDKWKEFWFQPDSRSVFFIAKDNIIFHWLIFPGLLMAYNASSDEQYNLPYNVSSTEFLNYENDKFSKSRGVGIWIDDALELCDVDYWRYTLIRNRPEFKDQSFLWSEFQNNINELNDVIGNFIHRAVTFIATKLGGVVPPRQDLDEEDEKLLAVVRDAPIKIGNLFEEFRLKEALTEVVEVGRAANQYLSVKEPWHLIKSDVDATGHVLNICVQVSRALAILLAPFIPGSAQKAWDTLGLPGLVNDQNWASAGELLIEEGHAIQKAQPLFEKLDVGELQSKLAEMRAQAGGRAPEEGSFAPAAAPEEKPSGVVAYDFFQQFSFKVVRVTAAEPVQGANKLLKLTVDLGTEERTVVGGIAELYSPEDIVGKNFVLLENLEPKTIRGIESQGMLLAADVTKSKFALIRAPDDLPPGVGIR
ncbi:MAG TPA: methionine--tRNA ligase [Candidatus Lokiarchaeia archaeon]|nr:methionine--tRNA ligase [Candidatus Lokiarchaeia archaeon]